MNDHLFFILAHTEEIIHVFRYFPVHSLYLCQFLDRSLFHLIQRTKCVPQRLSSCRPYPFNMVQYGFRVALGMPLSVISNDKPVGLIPDILQQL